MDITEIVKYSGQGRCRYFECYDKGAEYGKKLQTWAEGKPWTLKKIGNSYKFQLFYFLENSVSIQRRGFEFFDFNSEREIERWLLN